MLSNAEEKKLCPLKKTLTPQEDSDPWPLFWYSFSYFPLRLQLSMNVDSIKLQTHREEAVLNDLSWVHPELRLPVVILPCYPDRLCSLNCLCSLPFTIWYAA